MLAWIALALPVLHALLALDLALLAATVAVALRLLARVRVAPQDEEHDSEEEPQTRPSFTLIPPQPRSTSAAQAHEPAAAPEQQPLPLPAEAAAPQPNSPVYFREENGAGGILADPIDGMPFHAGEIILVCRCGTGYHQETGAWLREHLSGQCVHCGAAHALHSRRLEPAPEAR